MLSTFCFSGSIATSIALWLNRPASSRTSATSVALNRAVWRRSGARRSSRRTSGAKPMPRRRAASSSSSMAREMSGWITSSPKRAVGGARVNVSPVLIYMLTGETLAVNELFQRKAIQFGDDLLRIGSGPRPWLAGRGVPEGDDRRDRGVGWNAQVLAHAVVFVGSDRVRATPDSEGPCRHHHVLRDSAGVET